MCGKQGPPTRLGSARSWRHRGEGRLLAQCLRLFCGTQCWQQGPLGGAWPGTPSSGPGYPSVVFALYLQMSLPGAATFPIGFSRWSPVIALRCLGGALAANCKGERKSLGRAGVGGGRLAVYWVPESIVACSLLCGGSKVPLWLACPLSPTCRTRAGSSPKPASVVSVASTGSFTSLGPQFPLLPP